jgi:hypothetical protein
MEMGDLSVDDLHGNERLEEELIDLLENRTGETRECLQTTISSTFQVGKLIINPVRTPKAPSLATTRHPLRLRMLRTAMSSVRGLLREAVTVAPVR